MPVSWASPGTLGHSFATKPHRAHSTHSSTTGQNVQRCSASGQQSQPQVALKLPPAGSSRAAPAKPREAGGNQAKGGETRPKGGKRGQKGGKRGQKLMATALGQAAGGLKSQERRKLWLSAGRAESKAPQHAGNRLKQAPCFHQVPQRGLGSMPADSGAHAGEFGPRGMPRGSPAAGGLLLLPKWCLWSRGAAARRCSTEATANVTRARARSRAARLAAASSSFAAPRLVSCLPITAAHGPRAPEADSSTQGSVSGCLGVP